MLSPTSIFRLPFLTGLLDRYVGFDQYSLKSVFEVTRIAKMHRPVARNRAPPIPTTQSPKLAASRKVGMQVAKVQYP